MPVLSPLVLPEGYRVTSVTTTAAATQIGVSPTRRAAVCPHCQRRSRRLHSRYWRHLVDLPADGRPVSLRVHARRFFCRTRGCPRRTFSEPLFDLATARAQRTERLKEDLQTVAFVLGGRPGARLARQLKMPASRSTLLRLVVAAPLPQLATPRALGVDDWAFRRGHRYGTILIDLETHWPVELLEERSADVLARWLREHPGVEIIARDRSGAYAEGAREGAPGAVQVADRWHLLKNLVDALERFFNGEQAALEAAAQEVEPTTEALAELPGEELPPRPPGAKERERSARRAPRLARYERICALAREGHSFREIAREMGMARATITRYVGAGAFPEIAQRVKTPSQLDPYRAYIEQRWQAGCQNGRQLYRELRASGYRGSYARLSSFLYPLRTEQPRAAPAPSRPRRSARRVACLFIRATDDVEEKDQALVQRLTATSAECAAAYGLAQRFATMVRERSGSQLGSWMEAARASGVAAIRRFAEGLVADLAAVTAGLTLPWSNGPTEGAVNRLKLIKRQMYGRAGFELLRRRVLYRA